MKLTQIQINCLHNTVGQPNQHQNFQDYFDACSLMSRLPLPFFTPGGKNSPVLSKEIEVKLSVRDKEIISQTFRALNKVPSKEAFEVMIACGIKP